MLAASPQEAGASAVHRSASPPQDGPFDADDVEGARRGTALLDGGAIVALYYQGGTVGVAYYDVEGEPDAIQCMHAICDISSFQAIDQGKLGGCPCWPLWRQMHCQDGAWHNTLCPQSSARFSQGSL